MDAFEKTVEDCMHPSVFTIGVDATLEQAAMEMSVRNASALVVVDEERSPVGVVSATDLLRQGRALHAPDGARSNKLNERMRVADLFSADPVSVLAVSSLREAARLMAKRGVHRLMVIKDDVPVGVLSVSDVLRAVADSGLLVPIREYAAETIAHVAPGDTVAHAMDRLQAAGVRALVVMDGGWPVGAFSQQEALAAQDAGGDALVERWMNPAVLCMPQDTALHRAAAQALAMHTPLIVTLDGNTPVGVLTATDLLFAVM